VEVVVRSTESWGLPSIRPNTFQDAPVYWTTLLKAVTVDYKSGGAVNSKTVWLFCCPNLFALLIIRSGR
jgi:hypothetical protein